MTLTLRALLLGLLLMTGTAFAFPENVRQGYFSCSSCHVSPTGGGVLTEYGRRAEEEFMATWSREKQADFMYGGVELPSSVNVGGDIRFLSIQNDNRITKTQAGIPMQADIELAWTPVEKASFAASFGSYSGKPDLRRFYGKYQFDENWMARAGRFYPAFGIANPDHSLLARKLLGFDEKQENMNVELGYASEKMEWFADVILGGSDEGEQVREQGYSVRGSTFVGERSTVGLSYLHGAGAVWARDAVGPFVMIGFSPKSYLLSEVYYQSKKPIESDDTSTPKHAGLISSSKAGYDVYRGVQIFASLESADALSDDYVKRQRAYGPGVQWIPTPHMELYAKLERKLDEAYSKDYGYQALLVTHYWF